MKGTAIIEFRLGQSPQWRLTLPSGDERDFSSQMDAILYARDLGCNWERRGPRFANGQDRRKAEAGEIGPDDVFEYEGWLLNKRVRRASVIYPLPERGRPDHAHLRD